MLWLKAAHIIAMVTWFAALFYLPRLYVYHAMTSDEVGKARFVTMETRLYRLMTISMIATWLLGIALMGQLGAAVAGMVWLHIKLVLVLILTAYHGYCKKINRQFAADANTRSDRWYRWFNEVPAVLLVAIVCLAVVKPL